MTELNIYDFPESVCCLSARLAIAEKGIEVTDHAVMFDQGMQAVNRVLAEIKEQKS